MSDFFNYSFPVIPENQTNNSTSGSGLGAESGGNVSNPRKPFSCFFTNPNVVTQSKVNSFGPLLGVEDRKFNLTNIFTSITNAPAYAVTDGILFIVPQNGSPNLVNIFLKPTTAVDMGVKIKYYAYRSINIENFFQASGSSFDLLPKNDSNILPFLNEIWKEFQEFNNIPDQNVNSINFEAEKIGFSTSQIEHSYKSFFKSIPDPIDPSQTILVYNLPKVAIGAHIGNFTDSFGFEVVIDEGDFSKENSDTGFEFQQPYFQARQCILNLDNSNDVKDYGNLPNSVSEKIFKESVYLFVDPASFYGAHVTNPNGTNIGGSIKVVGISDPQTSSKDIYENIVSKFINKDKIYLYIKGKSGRSFPFYDSLKEVRINISTTTFPLQDSSWPIFRYAINNNITIYRIGFLLNVTTALVYSNNLIEGSYLFRCNNSNAQTAGNYSIEFPFYKYNSIKKYFGGFAYISIEEDEIVPNELFRRVNIDTIFEEEDFGTDPSIKLSWVNNLETILKSRGDEIAVYNSKVIIDSVKNLRTYHVAPILSTIQEGALSEVTKTDYMHAGYFAGEIENSTDFCKYVLGKDNAVIWKGSIKDGIEFSSLAFRTDDNINYFNTFFLGITKAEYDNLISRLPKDPTINKIIATNINFYFKKENGLTDNQLLHFTKYNLQLQYDNFNGDRTNANVTSTPTGETDVFMYTTDNQFFFTKNYTQDFPTKYSSEFADITIDFRPQNKWMQYFNYPLAATKTTLNDNSVFYGFDWLRKGDNEVRLNLTESYLQYKISELYKREFPNPTPPPSTITNVYHNFFENIAENPSGDDPHTTTVNKKLYINVKAMYRSIPMNWKLPDGPLFLNNSIVSQTEPNDNYDKDYSPSWLSIPRYGGANPVVKLRLKIREKSNAKKVLKLYFDKQFFKIKTLGTLSGTSIVASTEVNENVNVGSKISIQAIGVVKFRKEDLPSGSNTKMNWIDFELENIAPITQLSIISVQADGKLAGKLYIIPNGTVSEKNVLIIKVQDTATTIGNFDNHEIEILKKFALVCNIKIKEEIYNGTLDLRLNTTFQQY